MLILFSKKENKVMAIPKDSNNLFISIFEEDTENNICIRIECEKIKIEGLINLLSDKSYNESALDIYNKLCTGMPVIVDDLYKV